MKRSLFIFRRDLRLHDLPALKEACKAEKVHLAFIFQPQQIQRHDYFSDNAFQFLLESLGSLSEAIETHAGSLNIYLGEIEKIIPAFHTLAPLDSVHVTRDYTPFARLRDTTLRQTCADLNIRFQPDSGLLLHEVENTKKADGSPYTVFTPFYKNAQKEPVAKPEAIKFTGQLASDLVALPFSETLAYILKYLNPEKVAKKPFIKGGRSEGLKRLQYFIKNHLSKYQQARDVPALEATSGLSAHHKFGTVSVRESYEAAFSLASTGNESAQTFISELYWRDFQTQIGYFFPHVYKDQKNFRTQYDVLEWTNDETLFKAWCQGKTGYPIVDAGMRELNETGYMHNRVRMIVASFLTKDLHIDWKWGEQYFAQKLTDYDPAVNNGSWQWAASTGCDAQPYFRIFNPWRQQERFDPETLYIKKWLPELNNLSPKEIHNLHKGLHLMASNYPPMVVDHKAQADKAKQMFIKAREA